MGTNQTQVIIHIPANVRELETLACTPVLGIPLFLRNCLTMLGAGHRNFHIIAPSRLRRMILKAWQRHMVARGGHLRLTIHDTPGPLDPRILGENIWRSDDLIMLDALTVITDPNQTPQKSFRVRARADIGKLERFLCENIRLRQSGWAARTLNKRISLPLSRILARMRVSPNAITVLNMFVGLAAGIGTAGETYYGLLWGGIFFQLASILDGCDGEVAKLTFRTSKFGQMIDTVSDNFALISFFVGLIIHHYRVSAPTNAIAWGIILLAGLATLLTVMIRYLRQHSDSLSLVTFDSMFVKPRTTSQRSALAWIIRLGKPLVKKEWFSLIFLLMAIAGVLPYVLYIAACGTWVVVGALAILNKQEQRQSLPAMQRKESHVTSV